MPDEDRARWNEKYRDRASLCEAPSAVLVGLSDELPRRGRALELAGGCGADAVWLAMRGLDVTVADVSDVALAHAEALARRQGVALHAVRVDLQRDPPPQGPWDLVTCSSYLDRGVWAALDLAGEGTLVWIHPTVANLERHSRPSARFLLDVGEGVAIVRQRADVSVIVHREGWVRGRHLSVVVARRGGVPR